VRSLVTPSVELVPVSLETAEIVGATGAVLSSTYVAELIEHGEKLPAASRVVAKNVVAVSSGTFTAMANVPPVAVTVPTTTELHPLFSRSGPSCQTQLCQSQLGCCGSLATRGAWPAR